MDAQDLDQAIATLQHNLQHEPPILPNDSDLISLYTRLFSSSLGSIALRSILTHLISILKMPQFSNYQRLEFIPQLLTQMENQQTNTEEQAIDLRLILADAYETAEDYEEVAKTLSRIPLDSSQRKMETEEKGKILIKIVRSYLEIDDPTGAETYLNRFKQIMHEVTDPISIIHFQLSQARIYDSRRDFLNASKGYHELSRLPEVTDDEETHTLAMAVKCAVLAPAGPARSRALKRLYDDERTHLLNEFKILQSMHLQRLISPADYEAFAATLAEHQLARMSDGLTVLQKAMFEHNLLAVSKVYANISVPRLSELLGMDEERAEQMTASMVQQGRLLGRIDGVEGWIYFDVGEATGETSRVTGKGEGGKMAAWDKNIEGLTKAVEEVFAVISEKRPEWVEANLVIEQ